MEDIEYRKFLNNIPMAYAHHKAIYDENYYPIDYTFLEVNEEFSKLTGLDSESIIGKNISEVLPELLNANFDWINYYGNIAKNLEKATFEQYSEPLNKWYKVFVCSTKKEYFTTLFSDISEQKKSFEELNKKKNLFTILLELSQDISEFTIDELIEKTLDFAEEQTDSNIAFYHFIEDDQKTISLQTWSTNTLQNMCKAIGKGTHYPLDKAGIWAECIRSKVPIIVNDYEEYHIKYGLPEGHAPINRFISMPVLRQEKIVAVLGVGNKKTNYTDEDVTNLKEISESLWNLISQKRLEQKVQNIHKRFELTLNNINSMIYITDIDNYDLLFMNDYGKKQLGFYPLGEKCHKAIYKNNDVCEFCSHQYFNNLISDITNKDNNVIDPEKIIRVYDEINEAIYTYEHLNPIDGKWYEIRDAIIQWVDGSLVKLTVAIDITKRKEAENSLKEIADNLQILNDTKDKFFSIISHDLKSPLGSFRQVASLLYDEYKSFNDEDRIEFLEALKDSSNQVYNLLDNLLDWSRSQRGLIDCKPVKTNIYDLVEKSISVVNQSANNKNIIINNLIPIDLIGKIDINLMNIIIRNLLSNSIKFSFAGSKIVVGYVPDSNLTIYVKDYGVGMDENKVKDLFRIDKSKSTLGTEKEQGTGLGLILSKEFVEKHNGKLRVESKLNEGTTFFIDLF